LSSIAPQLSANALEQFSVELNIPQPLVDNPQLIAPTSAAFMPSNFVANSAVPIQPLVAETGTPNSTPAGIAMPIAMTTPSPQLPMQPVIGLPQTQMPVLPPPTAVALTNSLATSVNTPITTTSSMPIAGASLSSTPLQSKRKSLKPDDLKQFVEFFPCSIR